VLRVSRLASHFSSFTFYVLQNAKQKTRNPKRRRKAGHVFISKGPSGPRVFLAADADGDGRYEAMAGDEVRVPAGWS